MFCVNVILKLHYINLLYSGVPLLRILYYHNWRITKLSLIALVPYYVTFCFISAKLYCFVCCLQLPSRDKYNCVNLRQYRVYKKGPDNDALVLLQNVDLHRITINDIDPYSNLTIGVSLVNNAGLESDIVETVYVGSELSLLVFGQTCSWQIVWQCLLFSVGWAGVWLYLWSA